MEAKSDYQDKIQNIAKMLPAEKLGEVLDFMEFLKGISSAKALFRSSNIDIYCSVLTRKELLNKPGLKDSERKKIITIFRGLKILDM